MASTLKPLQSIAVHVTEPATGAFQWALAELEADHTWSELQIADTTHATYREAMADGLVALQARIADLDAGPRATAGRHSPAQRHVHRLARGKEDEPVPEGSKPTRQSVFGFGLAN